jgi:hypothetical protein
VALDNQLHLLHRNNLALTPSQAASGMAAIDMSPPLELLLRDHTAQGASGYGQLQLGQHP